jgi:hypothetical protein
VWRRASRRHRILVALAALLALLAGAAAVLTSRGAYDTYPRDALVRPAQQRRAPAWTAPCWPTARWSDKRLCARVRGRVVWVQHDDADGDGDGHLVVVDRFHSRIVKLTAGLGLGRLPRIGAHVDAVGWLMRGGEGHVELNAQRLHWAGRTWSTQDG